MIYQVVILSFDLLWKFYDFVSGAARRKTHISKTDFGSSPHKGMAYRFLDVKSRSYLLVKMQEAFLS